VIWKLTLHSSSTISKDKWIDVYIIPCKKRKPTLQKYWKFRSFIVRPDTRVQHFGAIVVKLKHMIQYLITVTKKLNILYQFFFQHGQEEITIRVGYSQKQKGTTESGVFAIAFATATAFRISPSKLKLNMRASINCFSEKRHYPKRLQV